MNTQPPCTVCGNPATNLVNDSEELPPVETATGQQFQRTQNVGPSRYYCDQHVEPATRKMLSGKVLYRVRGKWVEST